MHFRSWRTFAEFLPESSCANARRRCFSTSAALASSSFFALIALKLAVRGGVYSADSADIDCKMEDVPADLNLSGAGEVSAQPPALRLEEFA